MHNWTDTLSSLGARFHIDEASQVEDFGRPLAAGELADGFVATVTDLGIIAAAIFLGSSQLWSSQAPPLLGGVSIFGALGYATSIYLTWRVLRAVKKSGNINSKD